MRNGNGKLIKLSDIKKVVGQISQKFKPNKVILFGSYGYGKPTYDSDVDLLVIMNPDGGRTRPSVRIRNAVEHLFPMDIIVRAPKEIERRIRLGDFFLEEILSKGKVLYESANKRMDRKGRGRL